MHNVQTLTGRFIHYCHLCILRIVSPQMNEHMSSIAQRINGNFILYTGQLRREIV